MDFSKYDDGFFAINETNGFLPQKDPLEVLPEKYSKLQLILNNLHELIKDKNELELAIATFPDYMDEIKSEVDIYVIQALFRGYAFVASAYLLQPAHLDQKDGIYGVARQILPQNVAQPFEYVAEKLQIFPYMEYHYAYSLGNYVKIDKDKDYSYDNLKMACSFSGGADENGFIMLHVDIVSKTAQLIQGIRTFLEGNQLDGLQLVLNASKEINQRRQQMWNASNYKNYNNFRAFIMGIKGNEKIFGNGVLYEGCTNKELRTYRGQTGAQDDTIPTLDIFTGVVNYYPDNDLTSYLLNLRQYRPIVMQTFFKDLEQCTINYLTLPLECKKVLYLILTEIYNFRNGHWQFVQKYIMSNTKYANATGGTPIISWIPNQIRSVLNYMLDVLVSIEMEDKSFYHDKYESLCERFNVLDRQQEELSRDDYNPQKVHQLGQKFNE